MTLESLYYISQTIVVFGILGSLVILIVQRRDERRTLQDEKSLELLSSTFRVQHLVSSDPEFASIWMRGLAGGIATLFYPAHPFEWRGHRTFLHSPVDLSDSGS